MIAEGFLWLTRHAPGVRRLLWRALFDALAARFSAEWWTFMNYGYADAAPSPAELLPEDGEDRYSIYLYGRVIDDLELAGKDVIEIGCGRGGGAAAIRRYWKPRRIVGLDISRRAVAFCRRRHAGDGIEFVTGEAEAVRFPDESFDIVVNVESSFCYPSVERFLAEVRRILKPGGHFVFADIRLREEVPVLRKALADCGLEILEEDAITEQVAEALRLDATRRRAASHGMLPWPAQSWLDLFVGVSGTRIPEGLEGRWLIYLCYKLRKPGELAEASLAHRKHDAVGL